jgi:hypothetical protein
LRNVLHGAQALVAIEGDLIVAGGVLRGAQVGARGGDLRIQLLVAQLRLFKRDLRRLDFIDKRRRIQLIEQVPFFTWLLLCT